jgi:8-amino-7-oxononanoate synthase
MDRDSAIFADKLNHASLNDAALLSRADFQRYRHNDMQDLANRLAKSSARKKLIVTDGIFSMDGDIAPVPRLLELCEQYDALLLIDDAHGFGVLGRGRGTLAHFGINSSRIIYMGTLGKAAGVFGAFAAAETEIIEFLIQKAHAYIYTTATPPLLAQAVETSVGIIRDEEERREHLTGLIKLLKSELENLPWRLLPSETAIQPLVIGDNELTLKISRALYEVDIWIPAIRPPTVAKDTARLRISLCAAHEAKHIQQLAAALKNIR